MAGPLNLLLKNSHYKSIRSHSYLLASFGIFGNSTYNEILRNILVKSWAKYPPVYNWKIPAVLQLKNTQRFTIEKWRHFTNKKYPPFNNWKIHDVLQLKNTRRFTTEKYPPFHNWKMPGVLQLKNTRRFTIEKYPTFYNWKIPDVLQLKNTSANGASKSWFACNIWTKHLPLSLQTQTIHALCTRQFGTSVGELDTSGQGCFKLSTL